ncbi:MAG: hypothetical protein FDZ70_06925 [Actinobacteria bacterium]|nr:MAG: hypothetical protein FDZ70_06925 [Actinomycetota bacterium]
MDEHNDTSVTARLLGASYALGVVERLQEIADEAATLERRIRELAEVRSAAIEQVEALARAGAGARLAFAGASTAEQREVLSAVLCSATIEDGRIVSYQWKDPFGFLERSPEGAFCHSWWAIIDALVKAAV